MGRRDPGSNEVRIRWYSSNLSHEYCELDFYQTTGQLDEVVRTMLPPEKRDQIQERIAAVVNQHGQQLAQAFVPLVQRSLYESLPIIEDEFRRSVHRHREEIDRMGRRWNSEIVAQRLVPLARKEVFPIVKRHGQPVAEEIGQELWDRASIWRFGWRAIYDRTPLPERNLVQGEWQRFVQNEAVPVMRSHVDDIVIMIQRILRDVVTDENIRSEMSNLAYYLSSDPETQALMAKLLKESLVHNDRLRQRWHEIWTSDEAKRAFAVAGDLMEPVVRSIGDDLFGTEDSGINPDFARVLRNQILGKDRRWIVARQSDTRFDGAVHRAAHAMPFPVVYLATPDKTEMVP